MKGKTYFTGRENWERLILMKGKTYFTGIGIQNGRENWERKKCYLVNHFEELIPFTLRFIKPG